MGYGGGPVGNSSEWSQLTDGSFPVRYNSVLESGNAVSCLSDCRHDFRAAISDDVSKSIR